MIPRTKKIEIDVPEEYINKEVEISVDVKHESKYTKYFGFMKDVSEAEVEEELARIRGGRGR